MYVSLSLIIYAHGERANWSRKIVKEGEAEAKAFKEFFEWCDSASQNINFEIKTAKSTVEKLQNSMHLSGGRLKGVHMGEAWQAWQSWQAW